ncbi:MAG: hypothetical protein JWO30_3312 [Fibrobacteres bacterium]|nr:hypothetical protein [Fibrobacterota bacterium]
MKTVQDWGFISKEQGLVKPKLQDNKIFHALTTAYENNQQQEIYGATENIVRREKENCEMALSDLKKLAGSKSDPDGTLKLVMDHYQQRLSVAREKEEKINHLSEDSRKMLEEYKKRTQELADVKRNLMESQSKLRELAKNTEKLLKKEEELRFIETNLRTELDKNKRNIINGLYEIVTDLSDQVPEAAIVATQLSSPRPEAVRPEPIAARPMAPAMPEKPVAEKVIPVIPAHEPILQEPEAKEAARPFTEGLFRKAANPLAVEESIFGKSLPIPAESVWTRDKAAPVGPNFVIGQASPPAAQPVPGPIGVRDGGMVDKAARLKMFEPGKSLCNKSMVKTPEGEVISEYFYSPLHPKEGRHYIFNSLYAIWSLLSLKARDEEAFQDRIETVFTDLLSRLEHSQNIHLESFLSEEINRDVLGRVLAAPRSERSNMVESVAHRLLNRIESVGPGRAGLIDHQFRHLPRPDFPPRNGLTA